jgi:hypothetical protein
MKQAFIILISIVSFSTTTSAQTLRRGFETLEILRIAETYRQAPNLTFDVTYTYADSADVENSMEQMTGTTKIKDGKFWTMLDSIEFVQGYQYRLTVMHLDSIIAVADKEDYGKIIQLPLLDSVFRDANIDSMHIVSETDSTNVLTVYFKPEASFKKYSIHYNNAKFLISKMQYFIADQPFNLENTSTALVEILFSNYSDAEVDPSIFKEDRFIYWSNDSFYPKSEFQGFRILNNTAK